MLTCLDQHTLHIGLVVFVKQATFTNATNLNHNLCAKLFRPAIIVPVD